ncbi:MAG: putative rane protein, partial [Lacunisphaera sp.]|nr:putative rane protein [Lacunisphaera sp.]
MKAFSIPMLYGMRIFYAKRLLRGLIEQATQTIYSEKFDFRELVNTSSRGQEGVALLRAYVAVQFAARLMAPLTQMDIDRALEAVQLAEIYVKSPVFTEIVNVHRELAEHYLSLRHIAILRGKLAHKNDEHSYEGAVYNLQRTNKGPVSNAQLSKLEVICKKMHNLNRQVEKA